ncbi:hypothetical protein PIIN_10818 [Serendipita indica DSM 11827]|nr:hypothetical protein PIIN_10818 [Serendipita indica DSM 11827]
MHAPPVTPPYSTPRLAVVNPPPVAQPLGGYQTAYISASPGKPHMVGSLPTNMTSNLTGHSPTGTSRVRTLSQTRPQQYYHAEQVYARPKGFFNRRGDEFIRKGVVRHQPHASMEWHPMFKDYPDPGQGWMDEEGNWIAERGGILKH